MCSNFTSVKVGVKILFQSVFFPPCYLTVMTSTQKKFNIKKAQANVLQTQPIIILDKCDFSTFLSNLCKYCWLFASLF